MSFFGRLKSLFTRSGDGTEVVRIVQSPSTLAGIHVNADTALKNATVWACVRYLSSTVAQLPWRVMQEMPDGARRAPAHPVQYLIATRPNREMTSFTFRETMVGWACRHGNGVAEIQRDARGVPAALWPQHPSRVQFARDESGELVYEIRGDDGSLRVLRGMDVLHLKGFGEGAVGLDVMSYAAESIGWAQATETFGAAFFGNGLNPSGFLYVPGRMTPDGKRALDAELKEKHAGPRKASRVMIVDGNMKFERASVDPENAQFIETRQHQVEEICRWFGVPPHKVMHLLRATFSNIEHQAIEVVVDSISPWCLRLEQEADHKLFGQNRGGFFTKLDLKGLLRGDFKSRQEGLQIQRRNGVINANTWRRLEDMDEIGPAGETYIVEGNMTTLDAVGQVPAASQQDADAAAQDDSASESAIDRARRQAARASGLH